MKQYKDKVLPLSMLCGLFGFSCQLKILQNHLRIDNNQFVFLQLSFNPANGHWEVKPVDVYKAVVHQKAGDMNGKRTTYRMGFNPLMLGDKDIIIAFDLNGNLNKVMINEGDLRPTPQPVPALQN